jgi:hypothetical protein
MVQRPWLQKEATWARRRAWRLETPRAVSDCECVRVTATLRERGMACGELHWWHAERANVLFSRHSLPVPNQNERRPVVRMGIRCLGRRPEAQQFPVR